VERKTINTKLLPPEPLKAREGSADRWVGQDGMRQNRKRKTMMDGSCCCVALWSIHRSEEDE